MCATCGCSDESEVSLTNMQTGMRLGIGEHGHGHGRGHGHEHANTHHRIGLEQRVLAKNDRMAEHNREWLRQRNVLALNLVSSPGAGKTTLLERTIHDLRPAFVFSVIEGDQQTLNDARRIQATGCPVVQINTGAACHLDAEMVHQALHELEPREHSLLLIENVGNLVCPALFDLGERAKVAVMSVTEGEDKPLKYPHLFRACRLLLLNKVDLLPYVNFDVERWREYALQVNPKLTTLMVSATRGDGLEQWYHWLETQVS